MTTAFKFITILLASAMLSHVSLAAQSKPAVGAAANDMSKFYEGILGTRFIYSAGSSEYSYKMLIDFKVVSRSVIELKLVNASSFRDDSAELSDPMVTETMSVNCKLKTYTSSDWLDRNQNNYGLKQYRNGDATPWASKEAREENGNLIAEYLTMICKEIS